MLKPRILVTSATGKTGSHTVQQLLEKGYPVRAMVRVADRRSEKLRGLGAEIVVGNLADIQEVRQALAGVQRAYFCPPILRDTLSPGMYFAIAAQENKLESVTVLSQWLADPSSPSLHTRDIWLTQKLFSWMPDVATVTVNPGWFASNYTFAGLDIMAQTGRMMLPLGEGLNAPPSDEDIARVVVGTLVNPAPHIGKSYRPTGPRLLTPYDIAGIFGKVLGRKVTYQDAPIWIFPKVAKSSGIPDYITAQIITYFEEYKRNAFAAGAPTDAVLEVGGREPEDFETIARRYIAALPEVKRSLSGQSRVMLGLMKAMVTTGVKLETYAQKQEFPKLTNPRFAGDSPEWIETHGNFFRQAPVANGAIA